MSRPALPLPPFAPTSPLRLERTTRLASPRALSLSGVAGWAWITLDDDPRDIVLGSGDRHTVPANRRVTVTALRPGEPFVLTVTPVPAPRHPLAALADAARATRRGLATTLRAARGPGWSA